MRSNWMRWNSLIGSICIFLGCVSSLDAVQSQAAGNQELQRPPAVTIASTQRVTLGRLGGHRRFDRVTQDSPRERRRQSLERKLNEAGVAPDRESIRDFLHSLIPSDAQRAKIDALVQQLDSESYHEREAATRELIINPSLQVADLQRFTESADGETRWRVQTILKARQEGGVQRTVLHVVEYIGLAELSDMQESLASVAATVDRSLCSDRVAEALAVTIGNHPESLSSWLHSSDASQREMALKAFIIRCRDEGEEVGPFSKAFPEVLMQMAQDRDSQIRLQVAEVLARKQDPQALPILLELVEASERGTSDHAASLLRALTGESFGFSTYIEDKERLAAIASWQHWFNDHGETAKLREIGMRRYLGRTLIATYAADRFLEIDRSGKVIWEVKLDKPFACQGLENGHRLVALYPQGVVIEFDAEGKEIWRADELPTNITSVDRLANGNTLIAAGQSDNTILEIDPAKNSVWEIKLEGNPIYAKRLPNGRTMVCLLTSNKIVEVDREGTILWSIDTGDPGYYAQRLENGNTLVRFSKGGAAEFRPDGTRIREFESNKGYTAQRLPDGTTLIADYDGIKLFDPAGNVIEENNDVSGYLYVDYY